LLLVTEQVYTLLPKQSIEDPAQCKDRILLSSEHDSEREDNTTVVLS